MKSSSAFFYFYYAVYMVQLCLLARMIKISFDEYIVYANEYTEIQYLSLYMLILAILEFASVMKFLIQFDFGGLIQLIPLKVLRYFCLFISLLRNDTVILRLIYLILDLIIVECFLLIQDQAFSSVLRRYNRIIGVDILLRNAFIARNFFIGAADNNLITHITQVCVIITFRDTSKTSYFNIVKTIIFSLDYCVRNAIKGENRTFKIISLFVYFVLSCVNIFIIVQIISYNEISFSFFTFMNSSYTIFSFLCSYVDYLYYGKGLDKIVKRRE